MNQKSAIGAQCKVGSVDIGKWMVRSGWALSDPNDNIYKTDEQAAAAQHKGLWALAFIKPEDWLSGACDAPAIGDAADVAKTNHALSHACSALR
jgi:endonuclease YncB( thermonuclease family)